MVTCAAAARCHRHPAVRFACRLRLHRHNVTSAERRRSFRPVLGLSYSGRVLGCAASRCTLGVRTDPPNGMTLIDYLTCTPEMARAMMSRWISLVPSKMV
jgi:hypothetical protein